MRFFRKLFGGAPVNRATSYDSKEVMAVKFLAMKGDVRAQSLLGRMFFKGDSGVIQDYTEALLWLRAASDSGDADAQGTLGMAYENALGVGQDFVEAAKLYAASAAQGNDAAAFFLGKLFLEGKGLPKDSTEAAKWMLKSAKAGNNGAQGVLMILYFDGVGVPKDIEEAFFWALLASRKENPAALSLLPEIANMLSSTKREEIIERARNSVDL
jgi:TPR repeat protein